MDWCSWRVWRLMKHWAFWLGIAIGLMVVVPKIVLQYGIEIGHQGETVAIVPGFIAAVFMIVGVFGWEARYVYAFMAAGVLANGLFYALIYSLIARAIRRRRSR